MNTHRTINARCAAPSTSQDQPPEAAAVAPGPVTQDDIRRALGCASSFAPMDLIDAAGDAVAQLDVLSHLNLDELTGDRDSYGFYLLLQGISDRLKAALPPGHGQTGEDASGEDAQ